jgi:GT2 family glycosyltransferase
VTVVLPVYNEAEHIDGCLESLASQDYEGQITVVVADGGSTDDTRERLQAWQERLPGLLVIDNPERRQSPGLNLAGAAAPGLVLVRADGHSEYGTDYVRRSVEALASVGPGWAAGGNMRPVGVGRFGRAVAAAMGSRLTMGPAKFHHADDTTEVDTVYLGALPRQDFLAVGGFRSFPSGSSEDADFYFRWRRSGRRVLLEPLIRSVYRPREHSRALWKQYWAYGQGKSEMLFVNGRLPSWRPMAPLLLVLGLGGTTAVGVITGRWWPLAGLTGAWAAVLGSVAARHGSLGPAVFGASAIMHLGYGLGMLWGLARGPGPVRSLRDHELFPESRRGV